MNYYENFTSINQKLNAFLSEFDKYHHNRTLAQRPEVKHVMGTFFVDWFYGNAKSFSSFKSFKKLEKLYFDMYKDYLVYFELEDKYQNDKVLQDNALNQLFPTVYKKADRLLNAINVFVKEFYASDYIKQKNHTEQPKNENNIEKQAEEESIEVIDFENFNDEDISASLISEFGIQGPKEEDPVDHDETLDFTDTKSVSDSIQSKQNHHAPTAEEEQIVTEIHVVKDEVVNKVVQNKEEDEEEKLQEDVNAQEIQPSQKQEVVDDIEAFKRKLQKEFDELSKRFSDK